MNYVPDRGNIDWMNLHPQSGYEQAGNRPVLVLSPQANYAKSNLSDRLQKSYILLA
jgi:mRNA interferase MazF